MRDHTEQEESSAATAPEPGALRVPLVCTDCGSRPPVSEVPEPGGPREGDDCPRASCRRRNTGTLRAVMPGEPTPGQVYSLEGVGTIMVDRVGHNGIVNGAKPSAIYRMPGSTSRWGTTTLEDWPRVATLIADPLFDRSEPWDVRPLLDAIRITGPRCERACYYLGRMLEACYTPEQVAAFGGPVFQHIDVNALGCQCPRVAEYVAENGRGCFCTHDELVLRAYARGAPGLPALSLAEREWCIAEAVHAGEGSYQRADLEELTDQALAENVLHAWADYVASQF